MHTQGEWFCQACTERGHQPKVKQGSPPKPRKAKAPKTAPKSASGSSKSAGPKKGSSTARKSALSLGLEKSRPATGMRVYQTSRTMLAGTVGLCIMYILTLTQHFKL